MGSNPHLAVILERSSSLQNHTAVDPKQYIAFGKLINYHIKADHFLH